MWSRQSLYAHLDDDPPDHARASASRTRTRTDDPDSEDTPFRSAPPEDGDRTPPASPPRPTTRRLASGEGPRSLLSLLNPPARPYRDEDDDAPPESMLMDRRDLARGIPEEDGEDDEGPPPSMYVC